MLTFARYFSSRPAIKRYAFEANAFLQVVKQMAALSAASPSATTKAKVDALRRSLGVLQHHDAISGTEKQHVADDYAQRLAETITPAQDVVTEGLKAFVRKRSSEEIRTNQIHVDPPKAQVQGRGK